MSRKMDEKQKPDWKRIGQFVMICVLCFATFTLIALAIEAIF